MSVSTPDRRTALKSPPSSRVENADVEVEAAEPSEPEAAAGPERVPQSVNPPGDTLEVAEPQPMVDELGRRHVVSAGPSTVTRIIGWDAVLFRATQKEGLRFERIVQDTKGRILHVEQDTYVLSTRWVDDVDDVPPGNHDHGTETRNEGKPEDG